jgi:hypothetical protein
MPQDKAFGQQVGVPLRRVCTGILDPERVTAREVFVKLNGGLSCRNGKGQIEIETDVEFL